MLGVRRGKGVCMLSNLFSSFDPGIRALFSVMFPA